MSVINCTGVTASNQTHLVVKLVLDRKSSQVPSYPSEVLAWGVQCWILAVCSSNFEARSRVFDVFIRHWGLIWKRSAFLETRQQLLTHFWVLTVNPSVASSSGRRCCCLGRRRRRWWAGRSWHQKVEIVAGRGAELLARRPVVDTALASPERSASKNGLNTC